MNITAPALRRLQVLYGQFEAHSLDAPGKSREQRIAWAGERIGRRIASFKDLTVEEGIQLIDSLQRALQVKVPSKTSRRPRMGRKAAEKAGTEGRRDQIHPETTIITMADTARIGEQLTRLGWDMDGLTRFLRGSRGPLKGRDQLRTLGDANKVYWALKHIPARKEQLAAS